MSAEFKFGVIGREIAYSKSADIFKAALETVGQSAVCDLISIEKEQLAETINHIRKGKYVGCSVTIPYKSEVIPLLDRLDSQAESIGAVNSISMIDGQLTGFNTDAFGFAYPLIESKVTIRSALVLGCGGSAKAVVYSLAELIGCENILVIGRSLEKLSLFKRELKQGRLTAKLSSITYDQAREENFGSFDLVVNCTPLGGWNAPDESPLPGRLKWSDCAGYYDLNYNRENKLIESAREAGIATFSGRQMLVAQALKSLELWTGQSVQFDPVYRAVFAEDR